MSVQAGEPLQPLATLQPREHALEHRAQLARVDLVEALAQRGIARRALDAVQAPQIRSDQLIGPRITVELKQRRILQPEHRQPRHQAVGQIQSPGGYRVLKLVEARAHPRAAARARSMPSSTARLAMIAHPSLAK